MARYTKKGLKDPQYTNPNRYILNKISGSQYDVIPYKGAKGDTTAQPMNDANMADIEDGLVAIDEDLAFIEADYINAAEHALKQNISEPTLTTTDKTIPGGINELVDVKQNRVDDTLDTENTTIVGAINEIKYDSEHYDAVQDDAIAIINNKINALPMNGSLKNIKSTSVGIPTSYVNIDMFNSKQDVANYQPLSLDYKGSAEPHIIVMKTIGDYIFDFSVEASHTNGTDTVITIEAWVDGLLYDTATRILSGSNNQINGFTGFFSYSKGSDTAPSEIYIRYKASQGNTTAAKAMINTNLQGNSATSTFTDTDHVTGINLNEPTYNGATTTFIINDLDARTGQQTSDANGTTFSNGVALTKVQAALPGDISNHLSIYDNTNGIGFSNNAMTYVSQFNTHKFTNPSSVVHAVIKDVIDEPKSLITKEYADANYIKQSGGEMTGQLTMPTHSSIRADDDNILQFIDTVDTREGYIGIVNGEMKIAYEQPGDLILIKYAEDGGGIVLDSPDITLRGHTVCYGMFDAYGGLSVVDGRLFIGAIVTEGVSTDHLLTWDGASGHVGRQVKSAVTVGNAERLGGLDSSEYVTTTTIEAMQTKIDTMQEEINTLKGV